MAGAKSTISAMLVALAVVPGRALACEDLSATGIPEESFASLISQRFADPAGVRSALGSRGIVVGANYIGEVFGNSSGGIQQSSHYDG